MPHAYTCTLPPQKNTHMHMRIYAYTCTQTHTCIRAHMYAFTYTRARSRADAPARKCVSMRTRARTCANAHTPTENAYVKEHEEGMWERARPYAHMQRELYATITKTTPSDTLSARMWHRRNRIVMRSTVNRIQNKMGNTEQGLLVAADKLLLTDYN